MRTEQGKGEQSVQRKRNERKKKTHLDSQKKRDERQAGQSERRASAGKEGERERFEGGSVPSAEVLGSPEQTLANRGAVVRVRVGRGGGDSSTRM